MIKAFYWVTKITSVQTLENGEKVLNEFEVIGKKTTKEIKEDLSKEEIFVSKEYINKELEFDLVNFMALRNQNLI